MSKKTTNKDFKYIVIDESVINIIKAAVNNEDLKCGEFSTHTVIGCGMTYIYRGREIVFTISRYNSGITLTLDEKCESYSILRWILLFIYNIPDSQLPYTWELFEKLNKNFKNQLNYYTLVGEETSKHTVTKIDIVKGDIV